MRKRNTLLALALLVLLAGGFTYQSRTQWEYDFEYAPSEKRTNELGSQGWELVAIQSSGPGMGNSVPVYVFKRPKQ